MNFEAFKILDKSKVKETAFYTSNLIVFVGAIVVIIGLYKGHKMSSPAGLVCLAGYYFVWLIDTSR